MPVECRVPLTEQPVAESAQLHDRRLVAVGEIRIAIAELLREVEFEPLRELARPCNRFLVVGKPLEQLGRREQHGLVIAAPLALAPVERRAVADRDEGILEADAQTIMRVRVSRDDGVDAERLGEVAQRCVATHVPTLVGPLELDEEPVAAEGVREPRRRVRIAHGEPVPRAAGEADEPVVQLLELRLVEAGRHARLRRAAVCLCAAVSSCRDWRTRSATHEQRDVGAAGQRHLGAGDRSRTPKAFAACANSSEP